MSDLAIIGGGPVGLCFGLAAARCGLRVVVLESRKAGSGLDDRRAIALSWGSVLKLARLGIDLRDDAAASPIRSIHVSRTGSVGRTLLSAGDAGVPSLGFVLPYGDIVRRLEAAAQACLDGPVAGVLHQARALCDRILEHERRESEAFLDAIYAEAGGSE